MGINRLNHAVYDTRYRLVWTLKYRKWVLRDEAREAIGELFKEILEARAIEQGKFNNEIVPVEVPQRKGSPVVFDTDEGVRQDSTVEKLSKLPPAFVKDGTVTAGNSSPPNNGASCLLMMTQEKACDLGLKPRLIVGPCTSAGVHPAYMGLGPVPAIQKLVGKTGVKLADFELIELNEVFAAQPLGVIK
jgi:acetyl-CoA C-acetyltransferase